MAALVLGTWNEVYLQLLGFPVEAGSQYDRSEHRQLFWDHTVGA